MLALSSHDSHVAVEEKKCSCRFVEMKNGLSFSQNFASFVSTSVGCRYFGHKLSPHFDAMSLVAQTPWKASILVHRVSLMSLTSIIYSLLFLEIWVAKKLKLND